MPLVFTRSTIYAESYQKVSLGRFVLGITRQVCTHVYSGQGTHRSLLTATLIKDFLEEMYALPYSTMTV